MKLFSSVLLLLLANSAWTASLEVAMFKVAEKGIGVKVGTMTLKDTSYGLLLMPHLYDLTPGLHGFHMHTHPDCSNNGRAAGGHFDPTGKAEHLGPYHPQSHLGDLPVLYVDAAGQAKVPLLAPRLTLADVQGHALMIHAGGDNYAQKPQPLGGGGVRKACGVVQ